MNENKLRLVRRDMPENAEVNAPTRWEFPCLRIQQGSGKQIYCFAVDGMRVHEFSEISRIHRDDGGELHGYQRPEVVKHIESIRRYIDSDGAFIPNAIVISFSGDVSFHGGEDGRGIIKLCLSKKGIKPGFVVDGQQRLAAIRGCSRESFPIYVTAFISKSEDEQREQFVLVNNTKPLPKGLINELLPSIDGELPKQLAARKLPALLTAELNHRKNSPFYNLIRMPTNPNGIVVDNSVQRMLSNSLREGVLRKDQSLHGFDVDEACRTITMYWDEVRLVFSEAWGLPPKQSRLMHGVGIVSIGILMDFIANRGGAKKWKSTLRELAPNCAWTSGSWRFPTGKVGWNALENTPKQAKLLSSYLLSLAS